jgi:putative acetyltransferase
MIDVVVLTGPCGVGKSSVGFDAMDRLASAGVKVAFVDGVLAHVSPTPPDDPFAYGTAERALRALWSVFAAEGHTRLLLSRVVEDETQLGIVQRAVPGSRVRLFRLVAASGTIATRLARREVGDGLDWHLKRSAEIGCSTLGEPVDAERPLREVVTDVLERTGWLDGTSAGPNRPKTEPGAPAPVVLRAERPDDSDAIGAVIEAAFAGKPYAEGDEADLVVALRADDALALSLVAEAGGRVVGQVAFSPARASEGAPGWHALGPVAVLPDWQGRGIGSRLVRDGLEQLAARGAAGCILVGDAAYYTRFGFEPAPANAPPGQPADYFMVKVLAGPRVTGTIDFHPAFTPGR